MFDPRAWWVNADDSASLSGGMLEVLGQLGAPESVLRPVREGTPTAADRAWEFLDASHRAGTKWLLVLDNADHPAVLAAHGNASPADHAGWIRPAPTGVVIVTTRAKDRSAWGSGVAVRELALLDDSTSARVLADLALTSLIGARYRPGNWGNGSADCRWPFTWPAPTWHRRLLAGAASVTTAGPWTAWSCR